MCGQLAAWAPFIFGCIEQGLRDAGYFAEEGLEEPNLMQWLDLVALGTVADVVPLTGINRAFVAQGIKVMSRRDVGVRRSLRCQFERMPTAYHLGFVFGPRVNAGAGSEAELGSQLLSTTDSDEAARLAQRLDAYNRERREIEEFIQEEASMQAESQGNRSVIMASGEGWHSGVIGIVAGRLKERYNLPACVVSVADGKATGSGRSIPGFDLGEHGDCGTPARTASGRGRPCDGCRLYP